MHAGKEITSTLEQATSIERTFILCTCPTNSFTQLFAKVFLRLKVLLSTHNNYCPQLFTEEDLIIPCKAGIVEPKGIMKSSSNSCYLVDTTHLVYHHQHRTTAKTDGVEMKGGGDSFVCSTSSFSSSTYSLFDVLFNKKGCTTNNNENYNYPNNEKNLVQITLVSDNALRPSDDLLDYLRLELNPNSDRAITSTMSTSTDHFSTTSLLCSSESSGYCDDEDDDDEYGYDSFYYDSVSTLGITPSPNMTPKTRNGTSVRRSPLATSSFMKRISSSGSLEYENNNNSMVEERSPTPIPGANATNATNFPQEEQQEGNKVAGACERQHSPSSRWCDNYQIVGADHQPIPHRPPIHSPYISTGTKKLVNFSTGANNTTATRGRLHPPPRCNKSASLMLSPMFENSSQEVDSSTLGTPLPPPPPIDDSPMDDNDNTRRRNDTIRNYSNDHMELHSILERSLKIAKGSK